MSFDFLHDIKNGTPMTEAAINECVSSFQTQNDKIWRNTLHATLGIIAIAVAAVAINPEWVKLAIVAAITLLMLNLLYGALYSNGSGIYTLTTELPENLCSRMLEVCEKTPEGRLYRQRVIEEGRKFLLIELKAMEAWAKENGKREECKRLYSMPTESAVAS